MRNETMYCAACEHEVRVLITDPPSAEGQASLHDSELVCLDIGERCAGNLCPIGASAPDEMVRRLMHTGLPLENLRTVRGVCPTCEMEADMALHSGGKATCTACGTTAWWVIGKA